MVLERGPLVLKGATLLMNGYVNCSLCASFLPPLSSSQIYLQIIIFIVCLLLVWGVPLYRLDICMYIFPTLIDRNRPKIYTDVYESLKLDWVPGTPHISDRSPL